MAVRPCANEGVPAVLHGKLCCGRYLQMRRLAVDLAAAGDVAAVDLTWFRMADGRLLDDCA